MSVDPEVRCPPTEICGCPFTPARRFLKFRLDAEVAQCGRIGNKRIDVLGCLVSLLGSLGKSCPTSSSAECSGRPS
jgi:hypothetical protein